MKQFNHESLGRRKQRILDRLRHEHNVDRLEPMFRGPRPKYTVSGRATATAVGGMGAIHTMVRDLGLDREIDASLELLKRHVPYHESDHVLNIAYNLLAGGEALEDLEVLRQDAGYMDLLGTQRIPDPTTSGDFLRRFKTASKVKALMAAINRVRVRVWKGRPEIADECAIVDGDGTVTPTCGEKKDGMGLSYKGIWGHHPLTITLANTGEVLYVVNRPGNRPSHEGAAQYFDQAIRLCKQAYREVLLRGDTDFSLTEHFDRWDGQRVRFVFGYDANPGLVERAANLPEMRWVPLPRQVRRGLEQREKRENTKERIVVENEYANIKLQSEWVSEFFYQPAKCARPYRMIVVRKNLSVQRGEHPLFDDVRYLFYVTNDADLRPDEIVALANGRCNQENLIEQLKNGVHALHAPANDLVSNWAYMVIGSLAWTLKAWFGLTQEDRKVERDIVRMEFKRFYYSVIRIPCQVVRTARQLELRLLAWTDRAHYLLQRGLVTPRPSSA